MVARGMDPRLQQRVDASDVIQEAYLEAYTRWPEYQDNPEVPIPVWLRFLTRQKMVQTQRHHLGVQARDPRRERALRQKPSSTSPCATPLASESTVPPLAAETAEMRDHLRDGLNELDNTDRQVLLLRHFRQLKNAEVAALLNLSEKAASKRYFRALGRLKKVMSANSEG